VNFDLLRSEDGSVASSAAPTAPDEGEFREQRRLKRTNSSEKARTGSVKKLGWPTRLERAVVALPTRNFFGPLRTVEVRGGH